MAMGVSTLMEGGIARLHNPVALPSRLAELGLGVGSAPSERGSLWRWGALLLLAALAAYGSLIVRLRLLVRHLHRNSFKSIAPQQHFFFSDDDTWSEFSSDDGEEDDDDDDDDDEELLSSSGETAEVVAREGYFGDFSEEGHNGGFDLRGGRDVVRAWDERNLRLDDSIRGSAAISLWDLQRGEAVRSFTTDGSSRVAACVAATQPAVVLLAGDSLCGGRGGLQVLDARVGCGAPAASAELSPGLRRRVLRFGGAGKVLYVGDGGGSASAVDLRRVRTPVGRVEEGEATWWDVDAVVVGGGDIAGSPVGASWSAATQRSGPRWK